ncbi:MAG: type IV toxin-antitoxin system AbiEi family antitoxin [Limisphaerales bacterium]
MSGYNDTLPLKAARERLAQLMGLASAEGIDVQESGGGQGGKAADVVFKIGRTRYGVRYRSHADAASVVAAVHGLEKLAGDSVPLVLVPHMGAAGGQVCQEAGIGWFDLSGNGHLEVPGLRVHVEGKPNAFKRPGRPRSVFAPKSARIARWLVTHPDERFSQEALARATNMGKGFVSRIVRRLEELSLVLRDPAGEVRPRDPKAMLEAWREAYDFSKHEIVRGHVPARSGDEVLRRLHEGLAGAGVRHAATGLAGAWLWTGFAGFRLVVMYVAEMSEEVWHREVGFHEVERGENVWLVKPNDAGVFDGVAEREGIPCVHPVQVYLDLKGHPERSAEAAEALRQEQLTFASYA